MAYSKLHSSIINSSLWCEPDNVRLLFITLLAMADKQGYIYGSRGGIERIAFIVIDDDEPDPWTVLMSPDQDSSDRVRSPENEGRRIEEVSGGFRLLNWDYYHGLRNDDDRAEQNRRAQEKYRNKNKPPSATVSPHKPVKAHTEAEAEADNGSTNVDPSVWAEFVEHRKAIKKPLGKLSAQKNRNILEALTLEQQRETVDRTIANNWTGLFPGGSKNGTHQQNPGPLSAVDRVRLAVAEREAAMQREEAHDKSIVATYEPDLRPQMDEQPWISG